MAEKIRMQVLFVGAFCAALLQLGACAPAKPPISREHAVEFARDYTAAWNSGEPARVAAFFAEDGSLSVNGSLATGRDAITAVAAGFMTAFPDMQLLMKDLKLEDGTVQYHWTFIGTNSGPGGTGNAVNFSGYEAWTFGDDGLVARSQGHFDEAEYQRQIEHGVQAGEP